MKKVLFLFISFLALHNIQAQGNLGHHTDNYAGVYSLFYNPAEIVDSRYRFHMNLFSFDATFSNNYIGLRRSAIFPKSNREDAFNDNNFQDNYLVERLNGRKKSVYGSINLSVLPSMMFNFGKKHHNALGLYIRNRTNINVNGINQDLAQQVYNELALQNLQDISIQNKNFSVQAANWMEYGLSYGRDVYNKGNHFVKVAGTFKLTQGLASAYVFSDNLDITFPDEDTLNVNNSDIRFGYSEVFSNTINDIQNDGFSVDKVNAKIGVGFDLGAVYEWRPNQEDYKYEMDGDPNWMRPDKNKYKLKVGLSLMDMGYIRFARNQAVYDEINANRQGINIEETFGNVFNDFENTGLEGFNDTLASLFNATSSNGGGYNMALPMRINANIDYNIWKGFYANLTASIAPQFKNNANRTNGISEFSITPRFEHKWFGFYLPYSVNTHGNNHLGAGVRLGPLVVGTNDFLPLAGKAKIYDANIYASLSIPVFKKLRDKDKDHVSRKKDECRKKAGTWPNLGCPVEDKDEDGVEDKHDECPEIFGLKEFNGCPDTDKDGIKDEDDACPEVAGIAEFMGCPDTDNDGVKDEDDKCPEVAGEKDNNGCPYDDKDKDGILDKEDDCPEVAGPKENNGCPYPDTDGDGVLDKDDKCVKTPGTIANNGCPEIKEEFKETLDLVFKNLEFVSGKSVIKTSSYKNLKDLATILNNNPSYNLKIDGHTDAVGSEESNQKLSEQRANAVKQYLIGNGVDSKRLIANGYGESQPVADNATAAGRQQNRRVELEIVFE